MHADVRSASQPSNLGAVPAPSGSLLGRALAATLFSLLLVACGGGGDGGADGGPSVVSGDPISPPTAGAAIASTTTDSAAGAKAAAVGADLMAQRAGAMSGINALFGAPIGAQDAPAATRAYALAAKPLAAQPLAVQASGCGDWVDLPCSGSASLDTNMLDTATSVLVGDYVDISFANVSGMLLGNSVVMNGRMRIDFLSAVSLNTTPFRGLRAKVTLDGFSGSIRGAAFGPVSDVGLLQIDSQGATSLTANGATYGALGGVSISGTGNYVIGTGRVRVAHWSSTTNYVDLNFTNWRASAGRPTVGSVATITGGSGSVSVRVTSSSQASVVYAVSITASGVTRAYTVTATYVAGSSVPTYTAVAA